MKIFTGWYLRVLYFFYSSFERDSVKKKTNIGFAFVISGIHKFYTFWIFDSILVHFFVYQFFDWYFTFGLFFRHTLIKLLARLSYLNFYLYLGLFDHIMLPNTFVSIRPLRSSRINFFPKYIVIKTRRKKEGKGK